MRSANHAISALVGHASTNTLLPQLILSQHANKAWMDHNNKTSRAATDFSVRVDADDDVKRRARWWRCIWRFCAAPWWHSSTSKRFLPTSGPTNWLNDWESCCIRETPMTQTYTYVRYDTTRDVWRALRNLSWQLALNNSLAQKCWDNQPYRGPSETKSTIDARYHQKRACLTLHHPAENSATYAIYNRVKNKI